MHDPVTLLMLAAAGAGAGLLGALLGVGGGVILIPTLVLGAGLSMHEAVGTSLMAIIAGSCSVGSINITRRTANLRLGMLLEISTAIGGIAGGLAAGEISGGILQGVFGVLTAVMGVMMWLGVGAGGSAEVPPPDAAGSLEGVPAVGEFGGVYHDPGEGGLVVYTVRNIPAAMGISSLAGLLSGLLGVGGGIFKVPAMRLLCGVPMKAAAATSNFMIGVTACAGAFLYYGRDQIVGPLTAAVVVGSLAGAAIGLRLNLAVKGRPLQRMFALLLIGMSIQMAWK